MKSIWQKADNSVKKNLPWTLRAVQNYELSVVGNVRNSSLIVEVVVAGAFETTAINVP